MADIEEKQLTEILQQGKKVVENVEGRLKEKKIKKISELKLQIEQHFKGESFIEIEKLHVKYFDANKNIIEKLKSIKQLEDNRDIWSANKVHEDQQFHKETESKIRYRYMEFRKSLDYLKEGLWSMSFLGKFKWTNKIFHKYGFDRELITEKVVWIEGNEKRNFLGGLLTGIDRTCLTIIFTETDKEADKLNDFLRRKGFQSASVHEDKSDQEQDVIFKSFREFSTPILVSTPFFAGGLGYPRARNVINFDMPSDINEYRRRMCPVENIGQVISFCNGQSSISVHDLVDHLQEREQEVPKALRLAADFSRRGKENRKRQHEE